MTRRILIVLLNQHPPPPQSHNAEGRQIMDKLKQELCQRKCTINVVVEGSHNNGQLKQDYAKRRHAEYPYCGRYIIYWTSNPILIPKEGTIHYHNADASSECQAYRYNTSYKHYNENKQSHHPSGERADITRLRNNIITKINSPHHLSVKRDRK